MAVGLDEFQAKVVGPYLLQKTLGKGQTGLVKLGVHCSTGKTVAVKIINREKLSKSVLLKVEREIAIMKLIDHPHVLRLYDVYENNMHLYLILEHVSGGELFDYLVRKGRLSEREARRFFKQIASAVDFCHKHSVCHRDLKPENLLLDNEKNIKVADFGMASLQVTGTLLETSCGSPHYACPEVIRGENYDGRRADVWSLGVILFALLVGSLPFDDDNLRVLLEKVKRGRFNIPSYVPSGPHELIKGMIDVNPKTRLNLDNVMQHPWMKNGLLDGVCEPVLPMGDVVQTCPIGSRDDIDQDVFSSMTSLGCFRDKHKLIDALLAPGHNEEKIIYFLLLERKEKRPSLHDDPNVAVANQRDPPRKRVDSQVTLPPSFQLQRARSHSIGSPILDATPPRPPRLSTNTPPNYTPSSSGYYSYYSPQPHSRAGRQGSNPLAEAHTLPLGSSLDSGGGSSSPWKRKISTTLKNIAVHSPRFGRKKYDGSPDASVTSSPQTIKRSWFASLKTDKEKEEVVVVYRESGLSELKAALLRSFSVVNIQSTVISETIFKCKYEKSVKAEVKGRTVLAKKVKFTTMLVPVQNSRGSTVSADHVSSVYDGKTYSVTFKKISGPNSRFTRVCDKIQAAIVNPDVTNPKINEFVDHDNPSGSSDDTLTIHSRNGVQDNTSRQSSTVSIEIIDHDDNNMSSNVGHPSLLRDESSDSDNGLLDT